MMVAFLSSCGKVPQEKIDAANAAIEAAKTAQADIYVPAEFAAIQDSMKVINTEVEKQKSKLFKRFKVANQKLDALMPLAKQVEEHAVARKEEVRKEAEGLLAEITTILDENKTLMKKAPRGKEGAAVLEQIKNEMAAIETSYAEAKGMYDSGAYMDALNKLKAAKESATSINTELKDAIAKTKKGKK